MLVAGKGAEDVGQRLAMASCVGHQVDGSVALMRLGIETER